MKIQIAVLVGSNGEWYPVKFDGDETDWAFATDCIGTYDDERSLMIYPDVEQRCIVNADVPVPVRVVKEKAKR